MTEGHSQVTAVRRLQFCAGHRVYKHESKCANLHGHNYVLFLHARAASDTVDTGGGTARDAGNDAARDIDGLDSLGRVLDFGQLKSLFAPWIEENWDHGFILYKEDAEGLAAMNQMSKQKLFVMDKNPTAENMALYILNELAPRLLAGSGVELTAVELWETENCFARVEHARR